MVRHIKKNVTHIRTTYLIRPRYTQLTVTATKRGAESIAKAERAAYDQALTAYSGVDALARAHRLGLDGIVLRREPLEYAGWTMTDMITGHSWMQPDKVYLPNGQPAVMGSTISWKGEVLEVLSMRRNALVFVETPGRIIPLGALVDATVV